MRPVVHVLFPSCLKIRFTSLLLSNLFSSKARCYKKGIQANVSKTSWHILLFWTLWFTEHQCCLKFCMSKVTKVGLDAKDEHKLQIYSTLKLVMEGNTNYKIRQNNLRHKFVSQLMFILLWCTVMMPFKFTAVNDIWIKGGKSSFSALSHSRRKDLKLKWRLHHPTTSVNNEFLHSDRSTWRQCSDWKRPCRSTFRSRVGWTLEDCRIRAYSGHSFPPPHFPACKKDRERGRDRKRQTEKKEEKKKKKKKDAA